MAILSKRAVLWLVLACGAAAASQPNNAEILRRVVWKKSVLEADAIRAEQGLLICTGSGGLTVLEAKSGREVRRFAPQPNAAGRYCIPVPGGLGLLFSGDHYAKPQVGVVLDALTGKERLRLEAGEGRFGRVCCDPERGELYAALPDGANKLKLTAYDAKDGAKKWELPLGTGLYRVSGTVVYYATREAPPGAAVQEQNLLGELVRAFDRENNKVLWERRLPNGRSVSEMQISGARLILTTRAQLARREDLAGGGRAGEEGLLALDLADGTERWSYWPGEAGHLHAEHTNAAGQAVNSATVHRGSISATLATEDEIYAGGYGVVFGLNAGDGKELWKLKLPERVYGYSPEVRAALEKQGLSAKGASMPADVYAVALKDYTVYYSSHDGLHAYDLTAQRERWRFVPPEGGARGFVVDGDRLYLIAGPQHDTIDYALGMRAPGKRQAVNVSVYALDVKEGK
ncbi:MAG: PQQ-like beta-propeller repeat protein [Planctomycetota bacterium]|nr:PQQ-like beta-propeller repeat protein [Planctomycetota bacterium]